MTTTTGSNHYQRGVELAEAGRYREGLDCICRHVQDAPEDAQALNDAGVILHCLGRSEEAIGFLARARSLKAGSAEIVWNLAEACLGGGLAVEAATLFDDMERMGVLNVDVLNRTATELLDQGRKGEALEVLLRSGRLWPQQEVLKPMLDVIRGKRPRVAFFRDGVGAGGVSADIRQFVQQRFPTESHSGRNPEELAKLMQQCDIAWFDGGGAAAVEATRRPGRARIVVSVGCLEARDRWPSEALWENVSIVVPIASPNAGDALLRQAPDLCSRTRLVVVPDCPLQQQLKTINDILTGLETEIERQPAAAAHADALREAKSRRQQGDVDAAIRLLAQAEQLFDGRRRSPTLVGSDLASHDRNA